MKVLEYLQNYQKNENDILVFLGGSCVGKNWRKDLIQFLTNMDQVLHLDNLVLINPYRKDWPDQQNKLNQQIQWECNMINKCDVYSGYFNKETLSPNTLFELGKCIYQFKSYGVTKFASRLVLSAHKDYQKFNETNFQILNTTKLLKVDPVEIEIIPNINKHGSKIIESYFKLLK